MNVFRPALALLIVLAPPAFAEGECEENFFECKDDCLIEFGGSIRVEMKKAYDKCMKKCTKVAGRCTERAMETKAGNLDEGALDGTPTSDMEAGSGSPSKKKKKKKAIDTYVDEQPTEDEPVKKKKEALSDSEIPRSERTVLKTDDEPPPSKKEKKEERAEAPKKEVIEMKMTPKKEEEDLRDDKPRASAPPPKEEPREEEEPPPPPKKKKKEEPPPRKEEDHDDLRFY